MWYRLKNGVEYSTNFKFFIENQLFVSKSGKRYSFNSRLESKCFLEKEAFNRTGELDEADIEHYTRLIHKEILNGKHGEGEFVN